MCLQAFNLTPKNGPPAFDNSLFDRCRQVGKQLWHLQENTVPRQLKDGILELSITKW